jgi:magnesium chelatase family protein
MKFGAPLHTESRPILQWVEVASSFQIPNFHIIGLPSPEVAEAKERIRAAVESSDLEFPRRRVVVNLAPASIRKRGTGLDLAMALAVLQSRYPADENPALRAIAWGELGLDGTVKAAHQLTRAIYATWSESVPYLFISRAEETLAHRRWTEIRDSGCFSYPGPRLIAIDHLKEAWEIVLNRFEPLAPPREKLSVLPAFEEPNPPEAPELLPLPAALERTIAIAATGSHHLLLLGPRGTGKSHATEWLTQLTPPSDPKVELTQSLLRELQTRELDEPAVSMRSTRRIGPQTKPAALLGRLQAYGVQPGEFTLAHGGILLADEFPEWHRDTRECLREPLERGKITLSRALGSVELPAKFLFVGNGNLCPCGGWPKHLPLSLDVKRSALPPRCRCRASQRKSYLARLSGPILDRIDLIVLVQSSVPRRKAPSLKQLRKKVLLTREALVQQWGCVPGELSALQLEKILEEHSHWAKRWSSVPQSLRSRHKILRIALTLSAWDERTEPESAHFMEASCYRPERFELSD